MKKHSNHHLLAAIIGFSQPFNCLHSHNFFLIFFIPCRRKIPFRGTVVPPVDRKPQVWGYYHIIISMPPYKENDCVHCSRHQCCWLCCPRAENEFSVWWPAGQPDLRQGDFHQEARRWSPWRRQADSAGVTQEKPGWGREPNPEDLASTNCFYYT